MELFSLFAAFAAWFAGGIVGVITGIGAGLVAMPVVTIFYDTKWAIALTTLGGGVINSIMLWRLRRHLFIKDAVSTALWMLAGGVIGLPLYFLLPSWFLSLVVGVLILVSYRITERAQKNLSASTDTTRIERTFAILAGATIACISLGGPWLGIFVAIHTWDRKRSLAFLFAIFIPMCIFSVSSYAIKGVYAEMGWPVVASVCLGVIAGGFAGFALESKVNDALFRKLLLLIVKLSGFFMLIQGVAGFFGRNA